MGGGELGVQLRLQRLFNADSGRGLIVAVDHGIEGVPPGLERLDLLMERMLALDIDAFLLNPGMFRRVGRLWQGARRPAVILALDLYVNSPVPGGPVQGDAQVLIGDVEEAVALGADAVKLVLVFGQRDYRTYAQNLRAVTETMGRARRLGVPVMLETVVWGDGLPRAEWETTAFIGHMMRIGVELGADVLKVPYVEPMEAFQELIEAAPVPVTLLGGAHAAVDDVVGAAERAVKAGAKGLVYGRNIWQQPEPEAVVRRLQAALHTA